MDEEIAPTSLWRKRFQSAGFWVTVARGSFAAILGLSLLLIPEKTLPILANFMGGFWLASGIMSLRWGASGERARRLSIFTGSIGVLTGALVLTRNLIIGWVDETLVFYLLGGVILLTGILHAFGGFRIGDGNVRVWSWTSFLLGLFEVVLGGLLIYSPLNLGPGVYWAATLWSFLGAFMIMGDALRQRAMARKEVSLE